MEEKRSIWKQVVVTAIITGIITVGGGLLINHFQAREPHLAYSIEDAIPFEGLFENIAIYNTKIENDGKKVVEDVVCQLSFSEAIIQQTRVVLEPSITKKESIVNGSYRLELPNLNPGEHALISVLVRSSEQLPPRPEISLRGKGVTGVEASEDKKRGANWVIIVMATITTYAALSSFLFTTRFRFLSKLAPVLGEMIDERRHNDKQRQILSYLCGIHKLNLDVERYLNMPSEASYWAESDRFAMLAIENPAGEEAEKRKHVLEDLLKYAKIQSKSEGIVHYNIARIAKAQKNEKEANEHLEEAKKIIPQLIKIRVELDPIWKGK